MNTRKLLGGAAATGLLTVALVMGAGTANAAGSGASSYDQQLAAVCGATGSDKDHRAYDDTMRTESNARSGPSTDCGVRFSTGGSRATVDYHCYRVVSGYHWTYLRLKGTSDYGWVRGDRLTDSGSNVAC
ncbi:hypothetical protein AB0I28_21225 [Phytomonospora sp. NPDC050363]|uniref:hypothetical protein n=1 Tax=Phytomonospora sp. NPDC050363 TaxID=3155642 RepID=UPI0033D94067